MNHTLVVSFTFTIYTEASVLANLLDPAPCLLAAVPLCHRTRQSLKPSRRLSHSHLLLWWGNPLALACFLLGLSMWPSSRASVVT
uniref:Uncharacterized protein n=1 Tax=Ixodes ricinus TaxID=34613 RepID=A0A6B0TY58_IXORI